MFELIAPERIKLLGGPCGENRNAVNRNGRLSLVALPFSNLNVTVRAQPMQEVWACGHGHGPCGASRCQAPSRGGR